MRDAAVHEQIDDDERERMMSLLVALQQRRRSASAVSTLDERSALGYVPCRPRGAAVPRREATSRAHRTRRHRPAMRATLGISRRDR